MKQNRALTIILATVAALAVGFLRNWTAAFVMLAAVVMVLRPQASCAYVTLTVTEILADVLDAFKTRVPGLTFFSTDYSDQRVKFGQPVLAQIPQVPQVYDHVAASGYANNAQSARSLLTDVPITIDKWKDCPIKILHSDATQDRSKNYLETIGNAGYALGKAVVDYALSKAIAANFSQSTTETVANHDYETLGAVRGAMNLVEAGVPRFGLVKTTAFSALDNDDRIASGDYHDQRIGENPYGRLVGIQGFQEVAEYPSFPTNNITIGTFTAATSDVITSTAHGLIDGDRVRFTTTGTLPAGLSLATTYYVRDAATDTFKVSATSGGAAVDITDTGSGTHTVSRYEQLNGFYFDRRAVAISTRLPVDSTELAGLLGIPATVKMEVVRDEQTGLSLVGFAWMDQNTHDIYITTSVMFGATAGKQGGAAGSKVDYAGHRVIES